MFPPIPFIMAIASSCGVSLLIGMRIQLELFDTSLYQPRKTSVNFGSNSKMLGQMEQLELFDTTSYKAEEEASEFYLSYEIDDNSVCQRQFIGHERKVVAMLSIARRYNLKQAKAAWERVNWRYSQTKTGLQILELVHNQWFIHKRIQEPTNKRRGVWVVREFNVDC